MCVRTLLPESSPPKLWKKVTRPVKLETRACKVTNRENIMGACRVEDGLSAAHPVCDEDFWIARGDIDDDETGGAAPHSWDRRKRKWRVSFGDLRGDNAPGCRMIFVCERMTMRRRDTTCEIDNFSPTPGWTRPASSRALMPVDRCGLNTRAFSHIHSSLNHHLSESLRHEREVAFVLRP